MHYDLPGSVEAYTQEAGRAGRDGDLSRCILLYRMSDTRVQNYFLTGKYPDIEEVQKVFGTLEIFGGQEGGVSLTDLRKISQLPLTKLKVVLALLKKGGLHRNSMRGKYVLTEAAREQREMLLNLANYETKKSYDQSKLAMMLQYAETTSCRRRFILNYFGEDFDAETCGACDNCLRWPPRPCPLRAYRIADVVYHPKFGQGTVERAEKDLVTVLFPNVGYKTLLASAVSREPRKDRLTSIARIRSRLRRVLAPFSSLALVVAVALAASAQVNPPVPPRPARSTRRERLDAAGRRPSPSATVAPEPPGSSPLPEAVAAPRRRLRRRSSSSRPSSASSRARRPSPGSTARSAA